MKISALFLISVAGLSLGNWLALSAEESDEFRPALVGNGPKSLVNLINVQKLLDEGQPDGAVMFSRGVFPPGRGRDFAEINRGTAGSHMLQQEVRWALNRSRFLSAIAHHEPVAVYFRGTVLFFAHAQPHLRVLANQNPGAVSHFEDFVAPQEIFGTARWDENDPRLNGITRMNKDSIVTLELEVNEKGKLLATRVLSEQPRGYNMGAFEKDMLSAAKFVPGFRSGKASACAFQMTRHIEIQRFWGYGSR